MAKYRAQILLEPEQHRALVELAERQKRSVSDLVREAVAEYVVDRTNSATLKKRLAALDELERLQAEIRATSGTVPEDFLTRIRDEHEEELWQRLFDDKDTNH